MVLRHTPLANTSPQITLILPGNEPLFGRSAEATSLFRLLVAFQSLHETTQTIAGRFLCPRAEIARLVFQQPLAQYALCARSDYANLLREDPSDSQPAMLAFILRDRDARIILINTLEDRTDSCALPPLQDYSAHFPGKVAVQATVWSCVRV